MRFVIKIGTSLVTRTDGKLNEEFLRDFIRQTAALQKRGHKIVVVSSGAVSAGRSQIKFKHEKKNIPYRQALAAVGQGVLVDTYREFFGCHKIDVAQALLTNYDFTHRENFLNAKNVFELLLGQGVIPIVNENDVTTIAELKFGDNDMLSAKTAAMVSADYLVILTDVDGLFDKSPHESKNAKFIPLVARIDKKIKSFAGGARSCASCGGMATKIEAAEYVMSAGISMFIACGFKKSVLAEIAEFCESMAKDEKRNCRTNCGVLSGARNSSRPVCTFFPSQVSKVSGQKKWLKPRLQKSAWIEIDDGARVALLKKGKSLLASGVSAIRGKFSRGDVILVKNRGLEVAYGQINYDAQDIDKIKKHNSGEIGGILGYSFEEEIMHRDRLVLSQT